MKVGAKRLRPAITRRVRFSTVPTDTRNRSATTSSLVVQSLVPSRFSVRATGTARGQKYFHPSARA